MKNFFDLIIFDNPNIFTGPNIFNKLKKGNAQIII